MEGTSSYGAGLERHLAAENVTVIEVLRPKRRARRGHKSDPADAEAAARAVLSGEATACPKSADGPVEAIRMLRAARRSAVKARTGAINQLKGLLVTAPEQVAAPLRGLRTAALVGACARLRLDPGRGEATAAAKRSLRVLAARWRALSAEISELDAETARLCAQAAPRRAACGAEVEAADVRFRDRDGLLRMLCDPEVQRGIDVINTHTFPMSRAGEAFEVALTKECGKIYLLPQE